MCASGLCWQKRQHRCEAIRELMRNLGYIAVLAGALAGTSARGADGAADSDNFKQTVGPFLAKHCVKCHGSELAEGKVRLDALTPASAAGADRSVWMAALKQLSLGTMPPEDEP